MATETESKKQRDKTVYVTRKKQKLTLCCEWEQCTNSFDCMEKFLSHISEHLQDLPESNKPGNNAVK